MKRRSSSRKAAKAQHTTKPGQRSATKAGRRPSSTITNLRDQIERQARELTEARERETATAEVLRVISSSPGQLEPVFQTMLEKATRLSEAQEASLVLREGGDLRIVTRYYAPTAPSGAVRRDPQLIRPGPASCVRRSIESKRVVQVPELADDQAYFDREPGRVRLVELGYRSQLSVPLMKDN